MAGRLFSLLLPLIMGSIAAAGPATTQSSRLAEIRSWLGDLADARDAVREQARSALMGLSADELPALRRAVADAAPLQAAQRAVLREIVTHVYLTAAEYDKGNAGFLGVTMPRDTELVTSDDGEGPVIVESRLAGFCSYRMLQNGDLVLAVDGTPLRGKADLIYTISSLRPGARITLTVMRQGRRVRLPITLDARPAAAEGAAAQSIEGFREDRQLSADKYWQREFASLVDSRTW